MKKILALLLVAAVLVTCTACFEGEGDSTIRATGGGDKPTQSQDNSQPTSATTPTTEPNKNEEITIAETVIYDDNGVKITVKGLDEGWTGPELKVLVENSSDKNIVFSGSEYVVNGVTISGYAYIDVAAGKKTNGAISFSQDDLETAGIHCMATIMGMDFHVTDSDSYTTMFDVPFSLVTSIAEGYVQEIDDSGDVLFEEAGVTVIAKSLHEDLFGYTVVLLVKNNTGKDVIINAENISVNGYTISGWLYDNVYADTVRFCEIILSTADLAENEIEKVEKVTFTVNVIDPDTFARIAESDEIGISVG